MFVCMAAMAGKAVVVMRLLASAYSVAEKAGAIVRKVLHSGELGIVEKVSFCQSIFYLFFISFMLFSNTTYK